MSKKSEWFASSREGQLAMGREWQAVLLDSGAAWGVPSSALAKLAGVVTDAAEALDVAKNETTRTPVATARCKAAFEALERYMWDMKRRYFLSPPLTDADLISLGLKPHNRREADAAVYT
jgi:hypothetical protein